MPEEQVPLQLGAPEVEHPVLQAQLLRRELLLLLSGDGNRRRLRRPDDLQVGDVDFDLARAQAGVARGLRPERDDPAHQHDGLRAESRGLGHHRGRGPVGIERELHQPGTVAQVDEDQAAEITPPVHPAPEPHLPADVGAGELTGAMGAERRGAHRGRRVESSTRFGVENDVAEGIGVSGLEQLPADRSRGAPAGRSGSGS